MVELHENEQYFWTDETVADLAERTQKFELPCCLCTPLLGRELSRRGVRCRTLDMDERFGDVPGFEKFDLCRPKFRAEKFGVIVCDPPFWNVSLSQLFGTIRLLSQYDWQQPMAICYPTRRSKNLCATFAKFGLQATGIFPMYQTVQARETDRIEFFANFDFGARDALVGGAST
jgi:hypothetical protein